MTLKIEKKITSYAVKLPDAEPVEVVPPRETLNEHLSRPSVLTGTTYKVKTPLSDDALYITINDVILNLDTEHEERRPYEIFINSKNMENYQWVVALTRLISAVFRKGGSVVFLAEELKAVFDPKGGYLKKGGVFMPSLVAEIGYIIEEHLVWLGIIKKHVDEHQKAYIEKKKEDLGITEGYPDYATVCPKCSVKAVIKMDNCNTCLNCSDSKCG